MRQHGLTAAVLVAAILVVYHAVGQHDFVDFDDYVVIVHNPNLAMDLGFEALALAFTTSFGITANWIPLSALSLLVDHSLYGENAGGYHLTNVGLHIVSSLLLFFALARMTGSVGRSAFVAGVFALHPLQVESVAWASERKGVLSGVFWMATLWCYAHYAAKPERMLRYLAVLVCLAAAVLAKPIAVTLPFVLLLLDYWPLRRLGASAEDPLPHAAESSRALLEKIPMFALAAAASAVTLALQRAEGATQFGDALSLGARVANGLESYLAYLLSFVWPAKLSVFYPHPYLVDFSSAWPAIGCGVLLAVVTVGVLRLPRRPYLAVGWLWFLGTLVPVIGLVTVGLAARADRYMYLPIIGLAIALAWGVTEALAKSSAERDGDPPPRGLLAAGATVVLIACAIASWFQVQHWSGTIPLFEHAVAVTDDNFLAHHRLAAAKLYGGRADEAEGHFRESVRSGPPRADVYTGLADVLAESGKLDEAVDFYRQSLEISPNETRVHTKLGFALLLSERFEEARPYLQRASAELGQSPELQVGLAMAASGVGDLVSAVRHYRSALSLQPGLLPAADKLAWILATSERADLVAAAEAIQLAEAVNTARRSARSLDTLAAAYAAAGRFEDATATAREAAELARESDARLVAPIGERITFYESGRPFIDWNSRAIH